MRVQENTMTQNGQEDKKMFEVTYQEVNKRDEVVTKRKSFKTAAARDKFVERASQKDNFLCVLAYAG